MWITILAMALAVSLEPFRVGMTILMLNRPRPQLQLLVFLCGGFAMGTSVGLIVLFALRSRLLVIAHLTLPKVQILIGTLALLVAAVVAGGRFSAKHPAPRARRLLTGRSLWVAGIAGLGIALPSVDYLAALAVILASRAAVMTQVTALLIFNIVAFALVEVPFVAYLLAPNRTRTLLTALHKWIQSRRRVEVAMPLAGIGCALVTIGIASL